MVIIYLIAALWSVQAICTGACQCGGCSGNCGIGCNNGNNNGRRRKTVSDQEQKKLSLLDDMINSDLCSGVTSEFSKTMMNDFTQILSTPGTNKVGLDALVEKMATWCGSQEFRRRLEADHSIESYFEQSYETFEMRRRTLGLRADDGRTFGWFMDFDDNPELPADAYKACSVYAKLLGSIEKMEVSLEAEKAAIDFAAQANGDGGEKLSGCGSVVDQVNAYLRAGKLEGISVINEDTEEAKEIIVVEKSSPFADVFGGELTATLTLASGAIVMKLMELCTYYEQFKTEAPKIIA